MLSSSDVDVGTSSCSDNNEVKKVVVVATSEERKRKPKVTFKSVPSVTEKEAKTVFEEYIYSKCCYGKKPLSSMSIINLETEHAYRYVLQTYSETSKTTAMSEAYVDNSIYGHSRFSFIDDNYIVRPRKLFQYEMVSAEVPNTSKIRNCDSCGGMGDEVCMSCHGNGKAICLACIGTGRMEEKLLNPDDNHLSHSQQSCFYCYGKGFTSCYDCRSTGSIQCFNCKGSGRIKSYLQLNVTFENIQNECLKKPPRIPEQLIRSCHDQLIFSEQADRLSPITSHSDADINQASSNLLDFHYRKSLSSRIIAQRHEIYLIPITHCKYSYNTKVSDFYICGLDQKIYAPNYPEKCCCCTIV